MSTIRPNSVKNTALADNRAVLLRVQYMRSDYYRRRICRKDLYEISLLYVLKGETIMNREIKTGGTYHHFKGFIAKVITVAKHTETGETLVVYECNGKAVNSNHEDGTYARPLEMFLSEVDHTKYPDIKQKYRFELIEESEENA